LLAWKRINKEEKEGLSLIDDILVRNIEFILQPIHPKLCTNGDTRAIYFNISPHINAFYSVEDVG
jgi:hypothetical protein